MRRLLSLFLLAAAVAAPAVAASAQDGGPVVDVVEIAGVIDRPIEKYLIEQVDEAERAGVALLVFQVDSLAGMKITGTDGVPRIVERIRTASVPVAVHVGPRDAKAAGTAVYMLAAADVAAMGPSTRLGPAAPIDLGIPPLPDNGLLGELSAENGRSADPDARLGANAALKAGAVDFVVLSVAEMLERAHGTRVTTASGQVTLDLPRDEVTVRFHQPGPIRRLLHTFSNATLVYIMLIAGAMLLVFELFQPGFGVAGVTAGLLFTATAYGLTVLPARAPGLGLLVAGLLLLTLDVALDGLGVPTALGTAGLIAGSLMLLPRGPEPLQIPIWVLVLSVASTLIMFVPVMTVVRRARTPISATLKREMVGEAGRVRSMLNPEGFVSVEDEVWRARSEDGRRVRVGEDVVVTGVEGTVLLVRTGSPSDPA